MGVSIGAAIILGVVWYYFIREAPEPESNSAVTENVVENNVVTKTDNYIAIRDGGRLNEQVELLAKLSQWPRDAETPIKLDTLGKRLELAETVLEHPELDEENRVIAARAALSAAGQIYGICLDEDIDSDGNVQKDLQRISNKFLNDKDPVVAREAKMSEVKLLVYDNIGRDLAGSYDRIQREILNLVNQSPNDPFALATIRLLAGRVKAADTVFGDKLYSVVLAEYQSLPNLDKKMLPALKSMEDKIAISQSEIGLLTPEIARTEKFEAYFQKLTSLINRTDTGIDYINRLYSVVGFLEGVREHKKAIRVLNKIRDSVQNRTDFNAKVQADRLSRFGLIRNSAIGKKLDFNDTDSSGLPVDVSILKNRPVVLAYYSPNNPNSENVLNELNQIYLMTVNTGVKFVAIAVEAPQSGKLDFAFHPEWIKIQSIPPSGPQDSDDKLSQIFKRLPVSHVPYFALVDPDGILREINIPTNQLKTRVEAIVSSAR